MARVGRLAGALLVESDGAYYLVGHLKEPLDFATAGFMRPADLDVRAPRGVRLEATGAPVLAAPWLEIAREGDALVRLLAARLIVERTGTVSERLWRLVTVSDPGDPTSRPATDAVVASWLADCPDPVWNIVRDAVLRCA